jgi:hypothetical protein
MRFSKNFGGNTLPTEEEHLSKKNGKSSKKKARKGTTIEDPDKPRQARLPQMDDPVIEELEAAAEKYARIRDERMALTRQEVDQQGLLLTLMQRHHKQTYKRDGIECKVVVEKERVKVKIKKED